MRASFVDELPRLPTAFLDERLPDVGWNGRAGYLQLSAPYAAAADTAKVNGWQVETRALDHLAIMTEPDEVAAALAALITRLDGTST
jgi:hypothetical protein